MNCGIYGVGLVRVPREARLVGNPREVRALGLPRDQGPGLAEVMTRSCATGPLILRTGRLGRYQKWSGSPIPLVQLADVDKSVF